MSTDFALANAPSIVSVLYWPFSKRASLGAVMTPVTSLPSTSTRNRAGPALGSFAPASRILSEPSLVGAAGAATAAAPVVGALVVGAVGVGAAGGGGGLVGVPTVRTLGAGELVAGALGGAGGAMTGGL